MITRLLLLLSILALAPVALRAQAERFQPITTIADAGQIAEDAHMAFERGETRGAMEGYLRIANSSFSSPQVWFNAGTAAYRSGDIGKAVLYYKRALKADPSYAPARRSLDFVSPATNQEEENFAEQVLASVFSNTSPALWVLVAQGFFLLACFALARALAGAADRRGHWLAVLAWCSFFTLVAGGIGYANYEYRTVGSEAVVVVDKSVTRTEPREEATAQLELPAGTVLELTGDPRKGFVRFKLVDGRAGFISTESIERI